MKRPRRAVFSGSLAGAWLLLGLASGCGGGDPAPAYREPAMCSSPSPAPAAGTLELGTGASDGVCVLAEHDAVPIVTGGQGAEMFVLALRLRVDRGSCLAACAMDCARCAGCVEATVDCGLARRGDLGCPVARGDLVEAHDLTMPFGTPDVPAEVACEAHLDVAAENVHLVVKRTLRLVR